MASYIDMLKKLFMTAPADDKAKMQEFMMYEKPLVPYDSMKEYQERKLMMPYLKNEIPEKRYEEMPYLPQRQFAPDPTYSDKNNINGQKLMDYLQMLKERKVRI